MLLDAAANELKKRDFTDCETIAEAHVGNLASSRGNGVEVHFVAASCDSVDLLH